MKANQVKCWFLRRGETGVPGENLSVQSREPTNSTHIWRLVRESNPGRIGGGECSHHCAIPAPPQSHRIGELNNETGKNKKQSLHGETLLFAKRTNRFYIFVLVNNKRYVQSESSSPAHHKCVHCLVFQQAIRRLEIYFFLTKITKFCT